MKRKTGAIWIGIGAFFLLNAILGRYLVLPGYLANLETGRTTLEASAQSVPVWKIIRFVLWGYSFKLGVFFVAIGVLRRALVPARRFWPLVGGGILYLFLAYSPPIPGPYPLLFGVGGTLMATLIVFIFIGWVKERKGLADSEKPLADYRLAGYFFFAMATYNLCPLLGVKQFGLYPEKMIRFGLQAEAASFASRVLIELVLGWFFIFLSHRRRVEVRDVMEDGR
jgi:hypothetical protein